MTRSPLVAAMLLAAGVVDAADLARLAAVLRGWTRGELAAQIGLPATPRAWRLAQRDVLLAALAVLITPRGAGPATAAARVCARLRRFGAGAVLGEADRLCTRILELDVPIPRERQVFNLLSRKAVLAAAVDYIGARGFELRPGHFGVSAGGDDEQLGGTCSDSSTRPRTADGGAAARSARGARGKSESRGAQPRPVQRFSRAARTL